MLKCGVRLFGYPHNLLQQKVMTLNGVSSAIGFISFDDRWFDTNDEATSGQLTAVPLQHDATYAQKKATQADILQTCNIYCYDAI